MAGTLTKADIISQIQAENGYSIKTSTELVETLMEILKSTLESGDCVLVSGFGKFQVRNKRERKDRNPVNGTDMMLAPGRVVTFKCSGSLRDRINGG